MDFGRLNAEIGLKMCISNGQLLFLLLEGEVFLKTVGSRLKYTIQKVKGAKYGQWTLNGQCAQSYRLYWQQQCQRRL